MINRTIHGYTIKRLIGTGGMADVYYAENSLGLPAAVKVLKQEYSQHKSVKERFVNEAKIMTKLNHPHIRKVMDMGELEGRPCIIMEYLEGQSLKEVMQSTKRIGDTTLKKYFDQCAQALKYTHSMDITHRDIKPSNIFITNEDEIKLFDFGIAKSELSLSQTVTGQTLGTVMYMSPEQVVDPKRVTVKTDVYSLGVTFYHTLIGKPPYDINTGSEFVVMRKIVDEDLDVDLLPAHWRVLISSCLRKKPEDRIALKEKKFNDEVTVVDDSSSPSEPEEDPNGFVMSFSWLYYLIIGLVLSSGLIVGIRSCGYGEINISNVFVPRMSAKKAAKEIAANMVNIPGGTFTMGCTTEQGSDCDGDERPTNYVTLSAFSINKYEVTQEQWEAIMGNNPSYFSGCDRCPVEEISWNDIQEFIRKLNNLTGRNYRLPTEAEWEYAARGGQSFKYSGANNIANVAWYSGNSGRKTHRVGSKLANGYGLYDMSGNVYEWCSDWFGSYSSASKTNPKGPSMGSHRVARGGSWGHDARYCRVSFRRVSSPEASNSNLGFRLAL